MCISLSELVMAFSAIAASFSAYVGYKFWYNSKVIIRPLFNKKHTNVDGFFKYDRKKMIIEYDRVRCEITNIGGQTAVLKNISIGLYFKDTVIFDSIKGEEIKEKYVSPGATFTHIFETKIENKSKYQIECTNNDNDKRITNNVDVRTQNRINVKGKHHAKLKPKCVILLEYTNKDDVDIGECAMYFEVISVKYKSIGFIQCFELLFHF